MYKNRTSRWLAGKYLLIIPVAGIMFLFIAATNKVSSDIVYDKSAVSEEVVSIKGRVTDEAGNAISGASIKIKNISKVSKTDVAGVFELTDVPLKSVITVSHPKFSGEELKITKPKPYYRIVLKRKDSQLSSTFKSENSAAETSGILDLKRQNAAETDIVNSVNGTHKKDYRKPYYYNAAVLLTEVDPAFPTIREIGKYLNKTIDFSTKEPQRATYPEIVAYERLAPSIYADPDAVRYGIMSAGFKD